MTTEKKMFNPSDKVGQKAPEPEKVMFNPAARAQAKAEAKVIQHDLAGSGLVPTWSASTLKNYEQCPYQVKLLKVDKIKEPEHPAAARGTAMHGFAEAYITGDGYIAKRDPYQ